MKKLVNFLVLISLFQNYCTGQLIKPEELFGRWRVKDWLFFENFKETQEEHKQRMQEYHKCLKADVIINSTGIKISDKNTCNLVSCNFDFSKNPKYLEKKIITDNDYTKYELGSEMIDSNIVGRKFVEYLDKNYSESSLWLIDTGCLESYGVFSMKICIANKNKIGLFLGEEMIILERITNRKKEK